jgi:surface carbohydrate biosynthesis protein
MFKKFAYFHIDEFTRDSIVAASLKNKLKIFGVHLVYGNRRLSLLLKRFPFLLNFCDCLIFPSVDLYRDYFNDSFQIKSKVFILPSESISGTENMYKRLMIHLLGHKFSENINRQLFHNIEKFFLWGKSHEKMLINAFPELKSKIITVGHPRYDDNCLKKMRLLKKNKIRIGLISRFDKINIFDSRSNLELIYSNRKIPGKELLYFQSLNTNIEDDYHNSVLDLRVFMEIIDRLDANKYDVVLRIHPRENRNNWIKLIKSNNINISLSNYEEPFSHWLNDIDLVITPPSTCLYDCMLVGTNAILIDRVVKSRINHANETSDDFDPIFNYFTRPESMDQLMISISNYRNIIKSDPKIDGNLFRLLEDELNYPHHNNSLDLVSKSISGYYEKTRYINTVKYFIFLLFSSFFNFSILLIRFLKNRKEESSSFILSINNIKKINSLVQ